MAKPTLFVQRFLNSVPRNFFHSDSSRSVSHKKIPRCAASRSERHTHIEIDALIATLKYDKVEKPGVSLWCRSRTNSAQ